MGLGAIAKAIGKGVKKVGKGIKDRHSAEGASKKREALMALSQNSLNQEGSSVEDIGSLSPALPDVDLGFYGHMSVEKTKKAFKSPTIKGGQNA